MMSESKNKIFNLATDITGKPHSFDWKLQEMISGLKSILGQISKMC